MTPALMVIVRYNEISYVTEVAHSSVLDRFVREVQQKWPELPQKFSMMYALEGDINCDLNNQQDYMNMFKIAVIQKMSSVTIKIKVETTLLLTNGGEASSSNTSQMSLVLFDHDQIEDNSHSYSMLVRWKDCIIGKDQIFTEGAAQLRRELAKFALYHGFRYKIKRNTKFRFAAECINKEEGCGWQIVALGDSGRQMMYTSKYTGDHTCGAGNIVRNSERMTADIIAQIAGEKLRYKQHYKTVELQEEMYTEYGCKVSYDLAWNGMQKALESFCGDYRKSYDKLKNFVDAIKESNPGSKVIFEIVDNSRCFKRLFVSFNACIKGFEHVRPILFLDSTFLTGKFRGQMLAATGKDGNNHLFNLAFAIVDAENGENWTWFMRNLIPILNPERKMTFVSDRHRGLLDAVSETFPTSPHGYCTVHLERNLRAHMTELPLTMREGIVKMFKTVTYARTEDWYNLKLEEMKRSSTAKVHKFMSTLDPVHYCHAFFPGQRYGEMTSNAAESLNNKFKKHRQLQIISLVDGIRLKVMTERTTYRELAAKWKFTICPAPDEKLRNSLNFGKHWSVLKSTDNVYEVAAKKTVMVDIDKHTCSCLSLQMDNFPCAHALAVIQRSGNQLVQYIDAYYHVETFRKCYDEPMFPVATLTIQPPTVLTPDVLPPIAKAQPGRRRKHRFKENDGSKTKKAKLCSLCRKEGHTKRKCQA